LDCIYQLLNQYPFSFEYNSHFLKSVLEACYSCQYGTFLSNCDRERNELDLNKKTVSFWTFINSNKEPFSNILYRKNDGVLYPSYNMKDLVFWDEFYQREWDSLERIEGKRNDFQRAAIDIIHAKDVRIKELQRELIHFRPDLFQIMRSTKDLIVKPILDEVFQLVFTIISSKKFEEELNHHKVLVRERTFSSDSPRKRHFQRVVNGLLDDVSVGRKPSSPLTITRKNPLALTFDVTVSETRQSSPKQIGNRKSSGSSIHIDNSFRPTYPPQWVADKDVDGCNICEARFNSFKRKHHCRNCGKIFCSKCCYEKRIIEKFGFMKPVRICSRCLLLIESSFKHRTQSSGKLQLPNNT